MMMMKARCFPTACIALRISATSKLFKDSKELKKTVPLVQPESYI